MMHYTIEKIYALGGKDDLTAGVTFKHNSKGYNDYGSFVTIVFVYTQYEREEMDKMILNEPFSHHGFVKAKYLNSELSEDKVKQLLTEGINSEDIAEILYYRMPKHTFHSTEKREITKLQIPMRTMSKGRDLDWMYGFSKRQVKDGIGLSPKERRFYLAGKLYYEKENLTNEENAELYNEDGGLREAIEWEYLQMKYMREEITDEEKQRFASHFGYKKSEDFQTLDKYLKQAGSSVKKLVADNIDQAAELFHKVRHFHERRLNVMGKFPIYMDIDSFLHIYMRHVEEFQVNEHFEHKDNFQWKEEDVFSVMGHVIKEIDEEYQKLRAEKPEQRFSKYGKQSIYFQGDYYTLHIEPNGRVSTFHKNRKEHENKLLTNDEKQGSRQHKA